MTQAPTVSLQALAERIETAHHAARGAAKTAIEQAAECGRLLQEAKAQVAHGAWLPWLEENTTVSVRQSQRYMRLAKCDVASFLTIESALAAIAAPKDDEPIGLVATEDIAEEQRLQREIDELSVLAGRLEETSGAAGIQLAKYIIERAASLEFDAAYFRGRCEERLCELLRSFCGVDLQRPLGAKVFGEIEEATTALLHDIAVKEAALAAQGAAAFA